MYVEIRSDEFLEQEEKEEEKEAKKKGGKGGDKCVGCESNLKYWSMRYCRGCGACCHRECASQVWCGGL